MWWQPVEQGVPNERVPEAVAGCHSLDHTPDERLVEKRIGLRLTDASYGDVFVGVELGSQHRDLGQGRNGCVAETPKHEGTRRTTSIVAGRGRTGQLDRGERIAAGQLHDAFENHLVFTDCGARQLPDVFVGELTEIEWH